MFVKVMFLVVFVVLLFKFVVFVVFVVLMMYIYVGIVVEFKFDGVGRLWFLGFVMIE